jgi:hypothetical protein
MIPIELPAWLQPCIYIFLGLMVIEIIVRIWSTINHRNLNQKLDEILSKVKLMMLQRRLEDEEYPQYEPHPVPTDQMIKISKEY